MFSGHLIYLKQSTDFMNLTLTRVSTLLIVLLNAKRVIFQPYHGKDKLHFDELMLISALY